MNTFLPKLLSRRLWRTLLVLLWMVVSYLALTPSLKEGPDLGWDKLNHTLAFVALAFAAWLGFAQAQRSQRLWMLVLLAYGAGIEILQLYVPGRSCEWGDLLADVVGIAMGASLGMYITKLASSRRQ